MNKQIKAIIKLQGGLGNQMFQYAFGCALAKKTKGEVLFDRSKYDKHKEKNKRDYELDHFNVKANFISDNDLKKIILKKEKSLFDKMLNMFLRKKKINLITEKDMSVYCPDFFYINADSYFTGYFQTEKYFADIRDILLEDFSLNKNINYENQQMLEQIIKVNAISLHVRRGDYLLAKNMSVLGVCGLDYYKKAIEYITNNVRNPHFFLFSDDIPWVVENLRLNYPYTVVDINEGVNSFYDLWLMKNCKHNIIANSSFSWWGAWLNDNQDKIVIAPKKWVQSTEISGKDIIPEKWIKL